MRDETAKTQAVTNGIAARLPLLSENEQMVLAAVESLLKQARCQRDLPRLVDIESEIIRLGHRPPTLPAIRANVERLEIKGYIVRSLTVKSYEEGRVA